MKNLCYIALLLEYKYYVHFNRTVASTDLDELIFALNSSSVRLGSETSHQNTEIRGDYDLQAMRDAASGGNVGRGGGQLAAVSRSIVDTHL